MQVKRLSVFLILLSYIFVLSGCRSKPSQIGDSSTGQDTEPSVQATQNSDSATQAAQSVQIPLNWQSTIINVKLKEYSLKPEIYRLTYDSYRELMDAAVQKHDDCSEYDSCYSPDTKECKILSRLKSVDYSEEFFSENTLLYIAYWTPNWNPFIVGNVTCEGNLVTCTFDCYSKQPPDEMMGAADVPMSVFIAIDTVLPQETAFQVAKNYVPIEADEYTEISNDFFVKYCK